jgi:gamma-glutamyl-gamma-aminobutyrate hydrolase PuuD
MAGICRGAQFLNVMAGGKMIQHVDSHGNYHSMTTIDGEEMEVSSTHHQMIIPPKQDALLVGWSSVRRSGVYLGAKGPTDVPEKETEVIYLPKINAVGMQYHPESMSVHSKGFQYAATLVKKYLYD